jgi:hypothetical protein
MLIRHALLIPWWLGYPLRNPRAGRVFFRVPDYKDVRAREIPHRPGKIFSGPARALLAGSASSPFTRASPIEGKTFAKNYSQ